MAAGASTAPERRILAIVLPQLLCELLQQRLQLSILRGHPAPRTILRGHPAPQAILRGHPAPRVSMRGDPAARDARTPSSDRRRGPSTGTKKNGTQQIALRKIEPPRAIVLQDSALHEGAPLEGNTELDAVNATAYQLGVRARQTIAQASASVDHLSVHALPRACVHSALKHIAEVALGFGSPVSFEAPDTVWVDISGSSHLYAGERELVSELTGQIKALGHSTRVAVASGPWLAQSFARHAPEAGVLGVDRSQLVRAVGQLPIIALPIQREAVSWFARLGLLTLEDLRQLPVSSLAARLQPAQAAPGAGRQVPQTAIGTILDLIQGKDHGLLLPHHPEELPREELFWDDPLENVEPLLFVLKGLAGRLSARLEGRGQAARELRLTLHYDRSVALLANPEVVPGGAGPDGSAVPDTKVLSFKLASPLFHAEDLERVMRLRLQRQSLIAPTLGLSLQASAVTEARPAQMGLSEAAEWRSGISTDPRRWTVLVAELSSEAGVSSVGLLATEDSHLLEKSSALVPFAGLPADAAPSSVPSGAFFPDESAPGGAGRGAAPERWPRLDPLPRIPTRLLEPPLEIHAPIRKQELWVVGERAFVVSDIRFEQRLEGIEWWDRARVFRDYFRVWLAVPSEGAQPCRSSLQGGGRGGGGRSGGIEALVFRDRARGKSYLQALYD